MGDRSPPEIFLIAVIDAFEGHSGAGLAIKGGARLVSIITRHSATEGAELFQIGSFSGAGDRGQMNIRWSLLTLPGYPFFSLAIFGVSLLIIYGMATYRGVE